MTENGDLRLTTLKWNLIKVELQSNPDVAKKKELEMKFINGTITEQEQSELNGLINTTKEVKKTVCTSRLYKAR